MEKVDYFIDKKASEQHVNTIDEILAVACKKTNYLNLLFSRLIKLSSKEIYLVKSIYYNNLAVQEILCKISRAQTDKHFLRLKKKIDKLSYRAILITCKRLTAELMCSLTDIQKTAENLNIKRQNVVLLSLLYKNFNTLNFIINKNQH